MESGSTGPVDHMKKTFMTAAEWFVIDQLSDVYAVNLPVVAGKPAVFLLRNKGAYGVNAFVTYTVVKAPSAIGESQTLTDTEKIALLRFCDEVRMELAKAIVCESCHFKDHVWL